jgi:hypothetical protein
MSDVTLTDVEYTNLSILTAIRISLLHDKVATCCRFSLDAAQADFVAGLTADQIWAIVAHVGPATLFPPRQDLLSLLQTPLPLAGSLAAVRPSKPGINFKGS